MLSPDISDALKRYYETRHFWAKGDAIALEFQQGNKMDIQ